MGGHVNYNGELRDFAGAVPQAAAGNEAFDGESLAGQMTGIAQAAQVHAQDVLAAEQYVTQANDGLTAYRQGATAIDSAYNGTDASNASALQNVANATITGMVGGSGTHSPRAVMPGVADLNLPDGTR